MRVDLSQNWCCPSFEDGVLPTAYVLHRSDMDGWEEWRGVSFHQVRISRLQDKLLHYGRRRLNIWSDATAVTAAILRFARPAVRPLYFSPI
jgi:hypothetical protein